jgi:hypothetical protein
MADIFFLTREGLFFSAITGLVIATFSVIIGNKIKPAGGIDKSLSGLLYLWSKSPIFTIFLTIVLGPLLEEIVFRLIGITLLDKFLPLIIALVLTSVAFGLAHNQFPLNLISGIMGVVLGYVYIKHGVVASFITHGLQNGVVLIHLWFTILIKTGFTIKEAISIFGVSRLMELIK